MTDPISRLFVPITEPEDVIRHLAQGVRHWKGGYSAYSLAKTWHEANDYPPKIRELLETSDRFRGARLVDGFFERCTELGDGERASQTDLLTIARLGAKLAVISIEGKAEESFGPPVDEWLAGGGRRAARFKLLCEILGAENPEPTLRYQLFHRAASAAIEAERYCCDTALLLVHSFSTKQTSLSDYRAFVRALSLDDVPLPETMTVPARCRVNGRDIALYFGWVSDAADSEDFWLGLREHADKMANYARGIANWIADRS